MRDIRERIISAKGEVRILKKKERPEPEFYSFIQKRAQQQGIKLTELCDGLCTLNQLVRICSGIRFPRKLMQDTLVSRLGVCDTDCEVYLSHEDYLTWENMQEILSAMIEEDYEKLSELLEAYREQYDISEDILEQQFYWNLKAQMMRNQGAEETELLIVFERALRLTVPNYGEVPLAEKCLSVRELNLILEYIRYNEHINQTKYADELFSYVEMRKMDSSVKAMLLPKMVVYLLPLKLESSWNMTEEAQYKIYVKAWEVVEEALELLRRTGRGYYLWELLELRKNLLLTLRTHFYEYLSSHNIEKLKTCFAEQDIWQEMLESMEKRLGYSPKMRNDCFMWQGSAVFDLAELTHRRRKMLGLTLYQLSEGICDLKTLSRLENHMTMPQRKIMDGLFGRMGLPLSYYQMDAREGSPEIRESMLQLRRACNRMSADEMDVLLHKLQSMLSEETPRNQQLMGWYRVYMQSYRGEISDEEFRQELERLLQITLPEQALQGKHWCLSALEWRIIFRLFAFDSRVESIYNYVKPLQEELQYYEERKLEYALASTELFFIGKLLRVMSEWNKHKETMALCEKALQIHRCTHCNAQLSMTVYFMLRSNSDKRRKKWKNPEKIECLKFCIQLARFYYDTAAEEFYEQVLRLNE